MTSVGSGSLIIIALMALYPTLKASELVGTDLVQAVPLVASAALGHILFGDFKMDLTTSLLIGCIPGVWVGAHLSARAPGGLVRRALAFVLLASALKLLNVSNRDTGDRPARRARRGARALDAGAPRITDSPRIARAGAPRPRAAPPRSRRR